jgi:hypothetical protein
MPKKIFVSHSHKDELFIFFVKEFLEPVLEKSFKNKIVFTHGAGSLKPGEVDLTLLDQVRESLFLICCISENYLTSSFCILEYCTAYNKALFYPSNILIAPILLDDHDYTKTLPTSRNVIHATLTKKDSLIALYEQLKEVFDEKLLPSKKTYTAKLDEWYERYLKLKRETPAKSDKRNLFVDVINSFSNGQSDIDEPITVFCNRKEYEELSIRSTTKADQLLVWTIYKSPLFVSEAYEIHPKYTECQFLTEYDKIFRDCKNTRNRYRLVIFDDFEMANQYFQCNDDTLQVVNDGFIISNKVTIEQLKKRKAAFEDSNRDHLYFTTKEKINEWYYQRCSQYIPDNFDYEFGFVGNRQCNSCHFGFTSGFHAKAGKSDNNRPQHVIIYPRKLDHDIRNEIEHNPHDYKLFSDLLIQIDLVKELIDKNSKLRNLIIYNKIDSNNIELLR